MSTTSQSLLRSGIRGLKKTTAATFLAVELQSMLPHIHRDIADDSGTIEEYIESATDHAEQYQNRCLCESEWEASFDYFPDVLYLPIPPVQSVDSITYVDTDGTTRTLSASLYTVDVRSQPARITPAFGQIWPSVRTQVGSVVVAFTAGYASASLIPARTRQAIRMLAAHWYLNREAVVVGQSAGVMPIGVTELLDQDKLLNYR